MAVRKIEWSLNARKDLIDILDFYLKRNKSNTYSIKLSRRINNSIHLISSNPTLGTKTDYDNVRALINGDYQIIYEVFDKMILIIMIWDCRRNPKKRKIGKRIKGQR